MARIRSIKPEFWKNEGLSELPEATHLLAAALLNYADDHGYFNANPKLIQAECSPLREPSVSIRESLASLRTIGYLRLGSTVDGRLYGQIVKFDDHQKVDHPTKSKIADLSITWNEAREILSNPRETLAPDQGSGSRDQGAGSRDFCTAAAPPAARVAQSSGPVPRGTVEEPGWQLDFKLAYPERAGDPNWRGAWRAANARIAEGHTPDEFLAGARRYAEFVRATGKANTEFVKQAATFLGPGKPFLEPWTLPATRAQAQQDANVSASRVWLAEQEARDAAG